MKKTIGPSLLGALALVGCDSKVCTEVGCSNAVEVTFDADDGSALGKYVLSVKVDDEEAECRFTLGSENSDVGTAGAGGGGGATGEGTVVDAECSGSLGLALEITGARRFEGFVVSNSSWADAPPKKLSFEVLLGDDAFAAETFEPEFEEHQPNGDGCPPVCKVARHETSLEAD